VSKKTEAAFPTRLSPVRKKPEASDSPQDLRVVPVHYLDQVSVRWFMPVPSALKYAHEHKIAQRGIKPVNILLTAF
jgi:serine/threonine protein kinase